MILANEVNPSSSGTLTICAPPSASEVDKERLLPLRLLIIQYEDTDLHLILSLQQHDSLGLQGKVFSFQGPCAIMLPMKLGCIYLWGSESCIGSDFGTHHSCEPCWPAYS